ncbi:hypothetical protein IW261DRAFT_1419597 [Armillaria novae-zelandiae]|uniref:Uncharacterized protein n=1 Tax=Armillaria novae-zelandiae TaxID=153914 RepID=A0AA39UEQ9_9AGAR|nr:hypothetical protein IW261DRAFT_1419597 [Armillaria novae-zelandiae]
MPIKYYYIRAGLQAKDTFFSDIKHIYTCSSSLMDNFPAKILFEAERRYSKKLLRKNIDKMSIFSRWHSSLANPRYHYTLRAYNPVGWIAVTIEVEATNQGKDWSRWIVRLGGVCAKHFFQLGDHIEVLLQCFGLYAFTTCLLYFKRYLQADVFATLSFVLTAHNIRKSLSSQDGKIVVLDMGRALPVNENVEFLDQVATGIYLVQRPPHSSLFLITGDYTVEGNSFTLQSHNDKEQCEVLPGIHCTLVYKTLYNDTTQMQSIALSLHPWTGGPR